MGVMELVEDVFVEIVEGKTRVLVPNEDLYRRPDGVYEPAWAPVFYNPRMMFNRDVAVLVALTLSRLRGRRLVVVEPLGGTGVRGIRYAVEASATTYISDIDPRAVEIIEKNIVLNSVGDRVTVERAEANRYMYSLYEQGVVVDIVDIDPFGSPQPFIDAAIHLLRGKGVLAATATDVAVLGATYPRKLLRRYGIIGYKTYWYREQAVRSLLGYIVLRAAAHDYSAKPLLAYYADYYVRVYVALERGAAKADKAIEGIGYAYTCKHCGYTSYSRSAGRKLCPYCGSPRNPIGPIYTGRLCDQEFLKEMLNTLEDARWLQTYERIKKLLRILREECTITRPYQRIDTLCSYLHAHMPPTRLVIERIRGEGYTAVATHFDTRGLKTTIPHPHLLRILLDTSRSLYGGRDDV